VSVSAVIGSSSTTLAGTTLSGEILEKYETVSIQKRNVWEMNPPCRVNQSLNPFRSTSEDDSQRESL